MSASTCVICSGKSDRIGQESSKFSEPANSSIFAQSLSKIFYLVDLGLTSTALGSCQACWEEVVAVGRLLRELEEFEARVGAGKRSLEGKILKVSNPEELIEDDRARDLLIQRISNASSPSKIPGVVRLAETEVVHFEEVATELSGTPKSSRMSSPEKQGVDLGPNYKLPDPEGQEESDGNYSDGVFEEAILELEGENIRVLQQVEIIQMPEAQILLEKLPLHIPEGSTESHILSYNLNHPKLQDFIKRDQKKINYKRRIQSEMTESQTHKKKGTKSTNSDPIYPKPLPKDLACPHCDKIFTGRRRRHQLQNHIKISHNVEFFCSQCPKKYKNRWNLSRHFKRAHKENELEYVCNEEGCGKKFVTPYFLKIHQSTIHATIKQHVCYICGKAFLIQRYLQKHLQRHNSKTSEEPEEHFCEKCGKKLLSKNSLRNHLRTVHEIGTPLHICPCGRKFISGGLLKAHGIRCKEFQSENGEASNLVGIKMVKRRRKRRNPRPKESGGYHCRVCDKLFAHIRSLEAHEMSHDPDSLPFQCTHEGCDFKSATETSLKQHVERHDPERKYSCSVCGQNFRVKKDLVTHQKRKRISCVQKEPIVEEDESSLQSVY